MIRHRLPERRHNLAAKDNVLLHLRVAEIQIAVFQPLRLIRLTAAVDLKGELAMEALSKHCHLLRDNLNLAGCLLLVLGASLPDRPGHLDRGFLRDILEEPHHLFCLCYDLRGSVKIPHNNERKTGRNNTHILKPARKRDRLANVPNAKLATCVRTRLHHTLPPDAGLNFRTDAPADDLKEPPP